MLLLGGRRLMRLEIGRGCLVTGHTDKSSCIRRILSQSVTDQVMHWEGR